MSQEIWAALTNSGLYLRKEQEFKIVEEVWSTSKPAQISWLTLYNLQGFILKKQFGTENYFNPFKIKQLSVYIHFHKGSIKIWKSKKDIIWNSRDQHFWMLKPVKDILYSAFIFSCQYKLWQIWRGEIAIDSVSSLHSTFQYLVIVNVVLNASQSDSVVFGWNCLDIRKSLPLQISTVEHRQKER